MNKKEFEEKFGPIEAVYKITDFTELKKFLCGLSSLPSYVNENGIILELTDEYLDVSFNPDYPKVRLSINKEEYVESEKRTYDFDDKDLCYAAEILDNREEILNILFK